jgi:histone acetyltransferase
MKRFKGLDFSNKVKEFGFDDIPALKAVGWTREEYEKEKLADERSFEEQCQEIINFLMNHENSWPFRKPVDTKQVRDYTEIIKTPMGKFKSFYKTFSTDLETIQKKLD